MTIFDRTEIEHTFKQMAYGVRRPVPRPITSGYRLERGKPFARAGGLVVATPQFKTLTLYSPTSQNSQLPGATINSTSIRYPVKTK